MRTLIKNALIYQNATRSLLPLDMLCEDGLIVAIAERGSLDAADAEVVDAEGLALIPGFVDVHTHGRNGYDFVSCDADALHVMAKGYAACGVTTVMPTLASAPYAEMLGAAQRAERQRPIAFSSMQ